MLARWLAIRFAASNAENLLTLIEIHGTKLNPVFWSQLARQVGHPDTTFSDVTPLSRWVYLLVSTVPANQPLDTFLMTSMAEKCSKKGMPDLALPIFDAMTAGLLNVFAGSQYSNSCNTATTVEIPLRADEYHLDKLWEDTLRPNLDRLSEPLLDRTTARIKERHAILGAWGDATYDKSQDSIFRSAIEPHEQNEIRSYTDPLIDIARDCLEWLVVNRPKIATIWMERHINADPPLLRRLAIHTLSARTDLTDDQKLKWLLDSYDVNELAAHHELYVCIARVYPKASDESRTALIDAIVDYEWPDPKDLDYQRKAAQHKFQWLDWIGESDPSCQLAKQARQSILERYPCFRRSDHPDLTMWIETWRGSESPWSAEQLREKPAPRWLKNLLQYQPSSQDNVGRYGMLQAVESAVRLDPNWGLNLADAISNSEEWKTDLWYSVIEGWMRSELNGEQTDRALTHLSEAKLQREYSKQVASALTRLIDSPDISQSPELLDKANAIANELWELASDLDIDVSDYEGGSLTIAINSLPGTLAQFWTKSLATFNRQQEYRNRPVPAVYRSAFDRMVEGSGVCGSLARTVLASQLHFVAECFEDWTVENLLPLFDSEHPEFNSAWNGFLTWGRITPRLSGYLSQPFAQATPRLVDELSDELLMRFLDFYLTLFGIFETEDSDEQIARLLATDVQSIGPKVARTIGFHLTHRNDGQQRHWWKLWLKKYWQNRLRGIPGRLSEMESGIMLGWLPYLAGVFQEAVDLAVRTPADGATVDQLLMYTLKEDGLIDKYPEDVARLVAHLAKPDSGLYPGWVSDGAWMNDLLQTVKDPELKTQLKEAKLKLGL